MSKFSTPGQRAWFAYHCLDREPPPVRQLEEEYEISHAALHKFIWDQSKRPSYDQQKRIAAALRTTPEWLLHEEGPGPSAGWPIPPRPDRPNQRRRRGPVNGPRTSDPPN